ncbi:hypothetical protein TWF569_010128 [Orbilia oligospora]|uniref:Vacuolar ATPase assembly protein VMA22 n=1 Tax=Orbilia oligospora TaxID=2813651 RepID=A0A7C8NPJ5_ORBOL|nr:hypothetical protein TWF103_002680 [Orbilia oligospora]KAF3084349.1 hypothetical protein TWF102_011993 [Orbilia oligospora]KAF3099408.1 hypothetical protein TWF706_006511 [Orbilia oligospora]KAF3119319.1 hypothetical protein TWF703_003523 [Orbilia oligospora]KAF3134550.1 hypothetical protein TWF569_010128 [Orbilia oligospora]
MATQHELDELQDKLNNLIINYLDLFDKYQASRAEISRALSDGFLNLAQANFNAPNRVRYGQDMYDNRMQALRGVSIAVNETNVTAYILKDLTSPPEVVDSEQADPEAPSKLEGPDIGPEKEEVSEIVGKGDHDTPKERPDDSDAALTLANPKADPLRWFGILRPMALGTAQKNFLHGLPPIMELVSTLSEIEYHEKDIRSLRQKVRKMREELGIDFNDEPVEETATISGLDKLSISKDGAGDEAIEDGRSEDKKSHNQQPEKSAETPFKE